MSLPAKSQHLADEALLVKLAREFAIDFHDLETILSNNSVSKEEWERIRVSPRFLAILEAAVSEWNSALNTSERTRLKAAAVIEEWLPEANKRLHDSGEALPGKVQLATLMSRIAGVGQGGPADGGAAGEKVSITINLGGDANLKFEKQVSGPVIDVTPLEGQ